MRQPDSSQKLHQTIGLLPPAEFREAFGQMSVGIVYAGIQFCQTAHNKILTTVLHKFINDECILVVFSCPVEYFYNVPEKLTAIS